MVERVRAQVADFTHTCFMVTPYEGYVEVCEALAELTPGDLTANLVYAASGAVVDTTVVAGRVLMRGGEIPNEVEAREGAVASARRLGVIA